MSNTLYNKNVSFPKVLDLYKYCSDELKKNLEHRREYEKKLKEENLAKDQDKVSD